MLTIIWTIIKVYEPHIDLPVYENHNGRSTTNQLSIKTMNGSTSRSSNASAAEFPDTNSVAGPSSLWAPRGMRRATLRSAWHSSGPLAPRGSWKFQKKSVFMDFHRNFMTFEWDLYNWSLNDLNGISMEFNKILGDSKNFHRIWWDLMTLQGGVPGLSWLKSRFK
jgi:hypothetical protein